MLDTTTLTPLANSSTAMLYHWSPPSPGPYWGSFEQLRTSKSSSLDAIKAGSIGTLSTKSGVFRIIRDQDFQQLIGIASEIHRIKAGVTFVLSAAKVVQKHSDKESIELLVRSAAMLGESSVLPERDGHERFVITPEEALENAEDDLDLAEIPRPAM
jgi:hypothetical protein